MNNTPQEITQHVANIVVFDSGVGGLSICQSLFDHQADLSVHYIMDNAAFPYGLLDDNTLLSRVVTLCTQAAKRWQPDAIIIACNTASTLVLEPLRDALSIPIIGVVPAIKVAGERTQIPHIGLIATPATVNRPYTDDLIAQFAHHVQVRKLGSEAMIRWGQQLIESGDDAFISTLPSQLEQHLSGWLNTPEPLTHVVLGCTHFPLLKPYLETLWPHIDWIDSGHAIAKRLIQVLNPSTTDGHEAQCPGITLNATSAIDNTAAIRTFIEGFTHFNGYEVFEFKTDI